MQNSAFTPWGPLTSVGTAVVQVQTTSNNQATSYRIRCLVTGYISWAPAVSTGAAAPTIGTPTAPILNTPSANTLGMQAGQVEVIALPPNAYFAASALLGFEVVAGEGL